MEVILRARLRNFLTPRRRKINYVFEDLLDALFLETKEKAFNFPSNSTAQVLGAHSACTHNTL